MDKFKKELEIINDYLEKDQFNFIFPICERILNDDYFSQKQKSQIYFIMACTYKEIKNYEEALYYYSSCIKLDNNKEYAYVRKSELLSKLNRFEEALVCCKQGLIIFKLNDILINIKNKCVKELCQTSLKEPINLSNTVEKVTTKCSNFKVVNNVKQKKLTVLIIVVLISILVFLAAFFFSYRAYSS